MSKIIFVLLILCVKKNTSFKSDTIKSDIESKTIEPYKTLTYSIKYETMTNFTFGDIEEASDLQINIHSINCKIEVTLRGKKLDNTNSELFYFKVNSNDKSISIKPLIDIVEGEPKENYTMKYCPLTINSYYVSNETLQKLKIENKEENFIFFDSQLYKDTFNIYYEINKVSKTSYISIFFRYEKETTYGIDITYTNSKKSNSTTRTIEKTSFIFLDSEFLLYDGTDDNGILSINITNINDISKFNPKSMFFKIIEENNTCLLEKDTLNFGFITSKSTYQYYHTEILPGEEGELMLHNKRLYGVLHAKIVNKSEIDLNDTSIYPYGKDNKAELDYNQHKLQLIYSYNNTRYCFDGCYLLITYEQIKSEENFPLIGYEYTILSRTWNYTDSVSKLITIPPNEYIISCFGQGSSPEHFYSIHIPYDTVKIKIQLEGNYFDSYYIKERKKINIWNPIDTNKTEVFQLTNNRNVTILYMEKLEKTTDISLLFVPKDFFDQIFSYYYFKVLFIKKDENSKYLPIDSNLGNLCLPEFDSTKNGYYCYLKIKNNYNELNKTKFAISTENQNEYVKIDTLIKDNNNLKKNSCEFTYVYEDLNKNVDYILFNFKFTNNELKTIISSFCDRVKYINPPVYSGLMYYLDNFTKISKFETKNSYSMKFQFIYGDPGYFGYSLYPFDKFNITQNYRGKPLTIQLDNNISSIPFHTDNEKHIFYYYLINDMKIKGAEKITVGEPLTNIKKNFTFPLYYYLKLKSKEYINVDANIRLKSFDGRDLNNIYLIKGFLIYNNTLSKIINGEYIKFENPYIGEYSNFFGSGFLHVNLKYDKDKDVDKYLIIEIDSEGISHLSTEYFSLLEISAKEYVENKNDEEYLLPVNKYIIETFGEKNESKREENKYVIYVPKGNKLEIWIELNADSNDTTLEYDKSPICIKDNKNKLEKGFIVYKFKDINGKFTFSVQNPKNETRYLIRYSYRDFNVRNTFSFDDKYFKHITENNDYENYAFTFNSFKIETSSELLKKRGIAYYITGTLYIEDESPKGNYLLNNISSIYVDELMNNYIQGVSENNWTLQFRNFPKNNTKKYELRIQLYAILLDNLFSEEYFLYKIDPDIDKKSTWWKWLLGILAVVIALTVAIIIIVRYLKLKKKDENFQQEMKSLLFSNDIQKNVLIEEKKISKNESDFESTFI